MSKSETARNTRTADDFSLFLIFEQLTRKNIIARMVSSNNKIVSSRFFEQSNFEQMIMTRFNLYSVSFCRFSEEWASIIFCPLLSRLRKKPCRLKFVVFVRFFNSTFFEWTCVYSVTHWNDMCESVLFVCFILFAPFVCFFLIVVFISS